MISRIFFYRPPGSDGIDDDEGNNGTTTSQTPKMDLLEQILTNFFTDFFHEARMWLLPSTYGFPHFSRQRN
jgi:hypothetical protein